MTLIAFGNASNDLVGNILSVYSSNTITLAIGELLGSGLFLCCIVLGCVLVTASENLVLDKMLVARDIGTYLLGCTILFAAIIDRQLYWWYSILLFSVYFAYIVAMLFMSGALNLHFLSRVKSAAIRFHHAILQAFHPFTNERLVSISPTTSNYTLNPLPTIQILDELGEPILPPASPSLLPPELSTQDLTPTIDRVTSETFLLSDSISAVQIDAPQPFPNGNRLLEFPPLLDYDSSFLSPYSNFNDSQSNQRVTNSLSRPRSLHNIGVRPYSSRVDSVFFQRPRMSTPLKSPATSDLSYSFRSGRESVGGHAMNVLLNDNIYDKLRCHSLSSALELWSSWKSIEKQQLVHPSTEPLNKFNIDYLSERRPSPQPGHSSLHSRRSDYDQLSPLAAEVLSIYPICEVQSRYGEHDLCPICSKSGPIVREDNAGKPLPFYRQFLATFISHCLPIVRSWHTQSTFGRILSIVDVIPTILMSISIPVCGIINIPDDFSDHESERLSTFGDVAIADRSPPISGTAGKTN